MRFLFLTFALLLLFYVSSGQPDACVKDGGFCQIGLRKPCAYGSLPYNCGINAKCCRHQGQLDACVKNGGFCQTGLQNVCVYGSLPYNCGINAKCCKH